MGDVSVDWFKKVKKVEARNPQSGIEFIGSKFYSLPGIGIGSTLARLIDFAGIALILPDAA